MTTSAIKTIYLIHHTHTDIGFTHEQPVVMDLHLQFIDQAIEQCERTADYPAGARMKWTCEAAGIVQQWLLHRDDKQIERFVRLEKAGLIEVTGMFAVMSQCLSQEAAYRQFYLIDRLRRDYGMRINTVLQCDINGQNWGLVEAMLDSGIDGFAMAINENVGRAAFNRQRPNGFYWEGPSGRRILTWNGLHYNSNNFFGFPGDWHSVRKGTKSDWNSAVEKVPVFLEWLKTRGYPYPFAFFQVTSTAFCDNGPVDPTLPEFVRWWNEHGLSPRMELVTLRGFFDQLRSEPESTLPTHRGEWTDYWNIGAASTAYETSLNRRTYHRLFESEAVHAMLPSDARPDRKLTLRDVWENAWWYDEHTWGANTSIVQPFRQPARSQLNQKLNFAYRARSLTQLTRLEAIDRLARSVNAAAAGNYVMVVNPLPWEREERLQFPKDWLDMNVAATVSHVQYLDRLEGTEQSGLGDQALVTTAPVKVPAMGYRLMPAGELAATPVGSAIRASKGVQYAENQWLRVEMDAKRGGIRSLKDKSRRREWVDVRHEYSLGGYVFERPKLTKATMDAYGGRMQIFAESDWSKFMSYGGWHADWRAIRKGIGKVVEQRVVKSAGQTTLHQKCLAPGAASVVYEVTLADDKPYVDLRVTIDKLWDTSPEACYVAFPFAIAKAQPRYQAAGGVVRPHHDQLQDSNQDFHTVHTWADFSNDRMGVTVTTLDAPVAMFGGFNIAKLFKEPRAKVPPLLLSLAMTNYYHCNYAGGQLGAVTFQYRIAPHDAFDAAAASKAAMEAAHPLICHPSLSPAGQMPTTASLLQISNPAIVPLAVKPAESDEVLVVRLYNTSDDRADAIVRFPSQRLLHAWECDALENARAEISVKADGLQVQLDAYETTAYRIHLGATSTPTKAPAPRRAR